MRSALRLLITVLLGVLLGLCPNQASAEEGPTSAIIVNPDKSSSASLLHSDDGYLVLIKALGLPTEGPAIAPQGAGVGPYITVTWLIQDVIVWRVDRVFPGTDGPIWIATGYPTESVPLITDAQTPPGPWPDAQPIWHQASDSAGLRAFLDSALEPAVQASAVSAGSATNADRPAEVTHSRSNQLWGAGGLLLGAAMVWAVTRRHLRSVPEPPAGNEVFIDLDRAL